MRGVQAVYTNLFGEEQDTAAAVAERRTSRNPELHSKRNECLVDRYFYYVYFNKHWKYEYVLELLSLEFWLTPFTISDRLQRETRQLAQLKSTKPDKAWYRKKWPHLVWQ